APPRPPTTSAPRPNSGTRKIPLAFAISCLSCGSFSICCTSAVPRLIRSCTSPLWWLSPAFALLVGGIDALGAASFAAFGAAPFMLPAASTGGAMTAPPSSSAVVATTIECLRLIVWFLDCRAPLRGNLRRRGAFRRARDRRWRHEGGDAYAQHCAARS